MNSGRSTWKHFVRRGTALACFSLLAAIQAPGGVYVFFEKGFPSVENSAISRAALERALAPLEPRFIGLGDLQKGTRPGEGDLLILPYGSAFPADAWTAIRRQIVDGNLLVLGGRPLCVPVFGDSLGWRADPPTFAYARSAGIEDSYEAPQHGPWTIRWEEDAVFFEGCAVNPRRVFVNAGRSGRYRGLGLLVDGRGNRLAAPAVADDIVGGGRPPHRRVYLSFDADQAYWGSEDGIALMRRAARYASLGGVRLWLDFQNLTVDAGEPFRVRWILSEEGSQRFSPSISSPAQRSSRPRHSTAGICSTRRSGARSREMRTVSSLSALPSPREIRCSNGIPPVSPFTMHPFSGPERTSNRDETISGLTENRI